MGAPLLLLALGKTGSLRMAPGGTHCVVRRAGDGYRTMLQSGPRVCHQRPAAEVLMHAVAEVARDRAVGAVLTGMGDDGADGLLAMREAGARTFAQDEASSVVYGMPRAAWRNGGAQRRLPLEKMAEAIVGALAPASRIRPAG